MSHHSESSMFREIAGLKSEMERLGLGPTGEYPNGKLCDRDEGEIKVAIAADPARQVVLIDFGKPIASIGFTPDQAMEIADMLQKKAWECRGIV